MDRDFDQALEVLTGGFCSNTGGRRRNQVTHGLSYPMVGRLYEPGKGVMVIGRATNGWPTQLNLRDHYHHPGKAVTEARQLAKTDQMDWAKAWWTGNRPTFAPATAKYPIRKSAFWQVSRELVAAHDGVTTDEWPLHLAWSNLYKIAPAEKGNPTGGEMGRQEALGAVELLRRELECLRPAIAVMMVGWDWLLPFAKELDIARVAGDIVVGSGEFGGTRMIVTARPEGRKRDGFVSSAVREFPLRSER